MVIKIFISAVWLLIGFGATLKQMEKGDYVLSKKINRCMYIICNNYLSSASFQTLPLDLGAPTFPTLKSRA